MCDRDLLRRQRHRLDAAHLAELIGRCRRARALVDRDPALQVGQREGLLAVAAVGRADQVEERRRSRRSAAAGRRRTPSRPARSCRRTCGSRRHRVEPWSRPPQFCDGKMPCSAMQKLSTRNGCMFSCGWLPPMLRDGRRLQRRQVRRRAYSRCRAPRQEIARRDRRRRRASVDAVQRRGCACGISRLRERVRPPAPPASPRVWPSPTWIGTRPRRSGSAKVVWPLPP